MIGREEEAYYFLRDGEFEKAKSVFSLLLDRSPQNMDWVSGYFVSSFWDNKLDHLLSLREGKDRGKTILKYLDDFELEISKRKYPRSEAYSSSVSCVLEEATHHLGIAFRLEGWNGMDFETVRGLSICHIRLGNFDKALEILDYGTNENYSYPELNFLRAECLIGLGRKDEGTDLYSRAFLDDPTKFKKESVYWPELKTILTDLENQEIEDELLPHLIPVILLKNGILKNNQPSSEQDLQTWFALILRLQDSKPIAQGKYRSKINLRLTYYSMMVVEKFSERVFPQEVGQAKRILGEAEKELTDLLRR
jgi:tetratricopeptide (TPR) repeat protein